MKNRRAQEEGKAVGVLLLIIALFVVLYMLFIPPEERADLLGEDTSDLTTTNVPSTSSETEILADAPGIVSPNLNFGTTHNIPSVNLYVKTEPKITPLASSLIIKKALFSSTSPQLSFPFDLSADSEKVILKLDTHQGEGTLEIDINDNTIFTEEITTKSSRIIEIPRTFLKKNNRLTFTASGPGLAFWKTNQYVIKDIVLKEEFSLVNSKEMRTITLKQKEYETLKDANLEYILYCNKEPKKGVTLMQLLINNKNVLSRQLPCISKKETIEIPLSLLQTQTNTVTLAIDDGDFSFHDIKLITESAEQGQPDYTFTINKETFDKIVKGIKKVELDFFLEDTSQKKTARIHINDGSVLMKTTSNRFTVDISAYIEQGTNFIQILPSNTFSITGFKILLK